MRKSSLRTAGVAAGAAVCLTLALSGCGSQVDRAEIARAAGDVVANTGTDGTAAGTGVVLGTTGAASTGGVTLPASTPAPGAATAPGEPPPLAGATTAPTPT